MKTAYIARVNTLYSLLHQPRWQYLKAKFVFHNTAGTACTRPDAGGGGRQVGASEAEGGGCGGAAGEQGRNVKRM